MMKKGTFGERQARGLRDAIAYEAGEDVKLRVYEVEFPMRLPYIRQRACSEFGSKSSI